MIPSGAATPDFEKNADGNLHSLKKGPAATGPGNGEMWQHLLRRCQILAPCVVKTQQMLF